MKRFNKREFVKSGTATAIGITVGAYGSNMDSRNASPEELFDKLCGHAIAHGEIWDVTRNEQGEVTDIQDSGNEASLWYQRNCRGERR